MPPRRAHHAATVFAIFWVAGCTRGAEPCRQLRHCDDGYECLAQRCVPRGSDPVPPASARRVLRPNQVGLTGARGNAGQTGVQLHAPDGREIELLLDFPLSSAEPLEAAFLVLSSVKLPPTSGELIRLRVTRIVDPWSPEALDNGHSPQLGYETVSGLIRESQQARIDVTELVRPWLKKPEHSFGLAVSSPDPSQLVLALAGRFGEPFLELYTKAEGTRN